MISLLALYSPSLPSGFAAVGIRPICVASLLAVALAGCLPALEAPTAADVDPFDPVDTGPIIEDDPPPMCLWFADADGDGFGDPDSSLEAECARVPAGYTDTDGDCEDADPAIHPDAREICDGIDNNCDPGDDVPYAGSWHPDMDGDGYGAGDAVEHCEDPGAGWSTTDDDCDDVDPETWPGAPVACDDLDRNCDGVDDGDDGDSDGYLGCEECDDTRADVNPGQLEVCDDEDIDEDCDGAADDLDPEGAEGAAIYYADLDGDGWGDDADPGAALCDPGEALSDTPGDCDDGDVAVHPDAQEVCDDLDTDEDCDGLADDDDDSADVETMSWFYRDSDGDGYGDIDEPPVQTCDPAGLHDALVGEDCNDVNDEIHPDVDEIWYDGVDSDCAGDDDFDADADGWRPVEGDCDDADASANPDGVEVHANGVDEDCDGYDPSALSALGEGDLVVTEMMIDPVAVNDSEGEWFEILNLSGLDVDLYGLLVHDGASGGNEFTVDNPAILPGGAFFVFVRASDSATNGGVEGDLDWAEYGTFGFANEGDDRVVLSDSGGSVVFDEVLYDEAWDLPPGASLSLDADSADIEANDDADAWCRSVAAFGDGDLGTPGEENLTCYSHAESIQPLWEEACVSCHSADDSGDDSGGDSGDSGSVSSESDSLASAGLDLSGDAYETLLTWENASSGMALVVPHSAEDSYLWHKLSGTQDEVGGSGGVMPRGETLPPADRELVEAWILQGARP